MNKQKKLVEVNRLVLYGVRVGNFEGHKEPKKRNGTGQTWFPKTWTANDIQKAGEHV
ncbi:MAG: EndoU domain-containing protein, partial [Clostridia bacterium]|nr:EndoU domain-containing protein [Clostridia bacterium]